MTDLFPFNPGFTSTFSRPFTFVRRELLPLALFFSPVKVREFFPLFSSRLELLLTLELFCDPVRLQNTYFHFSR